MFEYYSKEEYFADHYQSIKKCEACMCNLRDRQEYYTLVYLEVLNSNSERLFSFHTPLPIAKSKELFTVSFNDMPEVTHIEQEGMFRFGRAIDAEEKIIFTEKKTLAALRESIDKYMLYLNQF